MHLTAKAQAQDRDAKYYAALLLQGLGGGVHSISFAGLSGVLACLGLSGFIWRQLPPCFDRSMLYSSS